MRAVMLAAGVGRRLAIEEPKVLLRFGGRTLLERHLAILARLGVRDVAIGIGYEALTIERALTSLGADGGLHRLQPRLRAGPAS